MPNRNALSLAVCLSLSAAMLVGVAAVGAGPPAEGDRDRAASPAQGGEDAQPDPAAAETAARAEILQSGEMLEAMMWFQRYFAASAQSSDEERDAIIAEIEAMTSTELRIFLLDFQQRRILAQQRQMSFDHQRAQSLGMWQSYRQQQQAAARASSNSGFATASRYFGGTASYGAGRVRRPSRGAATNRQHYQRIHSRALSALARARSW